MIAFECSAGWIPGLEGRHLDIESAPPRKLGDPLVGVDAEHGAAGGLELPGHDAGATADVDDVGPGTGRDDRLHHRIWVARPGAVAGNLTAALATLFDSIALGILDLVTSRLDLLTRLRKTTPTGIPVLTEATAMVASYLATERDPGRIASDADIDTLAPMLIGTGHLLFAGREGTARQAEAVRKAVTTTIAGVVQEPPL